MMAGVSGVLYFVGIKDQPYAFYGFFAMFLLLFFATGVGNASTFQMIPAIMRKEMARLMPGADVAARTLAAEKESAAITGFTSAIAAFGAFFIPKAYGTSIAATGGPPVALYGFLAFYVTASSSPGLSIHVREGCCMTIEHGATARSVPQERSVTGEQQ